ncbi:MAG: DJ-1/PfpI family protein [Sporolactobacillus sp.]
MPDAETAPLRVGIFLFHDVEVLDFAGPYEVFDMAVDEAGRPLFSITTLSQTGDEVRASGGLCLKPDCSFQTAPPLDILIIPGGAGARKREIDNEAVLAWIAERAHAVRVLASVCTGALLLGKAGLLHARRCTTHWARTRALGADRA